jgi:hypothetical protein
MSSLGIYFGPKVIEIVETKGDKLINQVQLPQLVVSGGDLEEKTQDEVKLIEIIALFKSELRKNKIEVPTVNLCLSGKDLIIRTFEMPLLPREELQNAVNFEAKKYIPFKVEDLISDFQLEYDKLSRSNIVLFMGIKKEVLERYVTIINQLNMKVSTIEYSAFSMLRNMRLVGGGKGVTGLVAVDLSGGDEANFMVLENGLPLFSRDITLSAEPGGAINAEGVKDTGVILDKLKTEARVSLDYYNRKFPAKNIQKIYIISQQEHRQDLEGVIGEIGLPVQFIDVAKSMGRHVQFSLSLVKGYSVSLAKTVRTKVRLNVLTAKAKTPKEKTVDTEIFNLFQGISINYGIIVFAALICATTFVFGLYRVQLLKKELVDIKAKRQVVGVIKGDPGYDALSIIGEEYNDRLAELDKVVKNQVFVSEPLNVIPRAIPQGMWLKDMSFKKLDNDRIELALDGTVYLNDSDKELKSINTFIANLRSDLKSGYFTEISIVSISRGENQKLPVTNFLISCRGGGKGKK